MKLSYESRIEDALLTLYLEGDLLGEKNGPDLIEVVNDAINSKVSDALIDISKIRYMNSSGIGVLITILTKFRNSGGDVHLVNPSEHVKKLLIITKLNAIFNVYDDLEQAKETLK